MYIYIYDSPLAPASRTPWALVYTYIHIILHLLNPLFGLPAPNATRMAYEDGSMSEEERERSVSYEEEDTCHMSEEELNSISTLHETTDGLWEPCDLRWHLVHPIIISHPIYY
jgi:hypothetical protein